MATGVLITAKPRANGRHCPDMKNWRGGALQRADVGSFLISQIDDAACCGQAAHYVGAATRKARRKKRRPNLLMSFQCFARHTKRSRSFAARRLRPQPPIASKQKERALPRHLQGHRHERRAADTLDQAAMGREDVKISRGWYRKSNSRAEMAFHACFMRI